MIGPNLTKTMIITEITQKKKNDMLGLSVISDSLFI
jgi:hypothetical protein